MTRHPLSTNPRRTGAAALVSAAAVASCANLEKEKAPQIVTAGPHALVMGSTISVGASTINGTDTGYGFVSTHPDVATADDDGVVHPVAPGETTITITGKSSHAVGMHAVVVVAADEKAQIPYYDKWMMSAHAAHWLMISRERAPGRWLHFPRAWMMARWTNASPSASLRWHGARSRRACCSTRHPMCARGRCRRC